MPINMDVLSRRRATLAGFAQTPMERAAVDNAATHVECAKRFLFGYVGIEPRRMKSWQAGC
jgi:hypothetical protein